MSDSRRWRDDGAGPRPAPDLTEAYRLAYERVHEDWAAYEPSAGARIAGRVGQQLEGMGPSRKVDATAGHPIARRWWVMVLTALLGGLIGVVVAETVPTPYVASVTLLVDLPTNTVDSETIIRTVEDLATSATVVDDVAAGPGIDLSPKQVSQRLSVERAIGAAVVQIFVTDPSAPRARAIANELRSVFQDRLQGYREAATVGSAEIGALSFTDPQVIKHERPVVARGVLGAVVGFNLGLLGVTVVVLRRRRQSGFRHIQM